MCQHALLACVCVCVCLCASSWIREAHGNTYCIAVATDPSPFLKMHTHSHTLILISSVINEEHTCVQCTEWESTFIACSRKKTWKEAYQLYHELHTHTQIPATGTCIVCHLGTQQWKVLALQGFFIYLCEFVHVKLCVCTPEYMHISNFTLTGSVLYLTFTLKS